MTLINNNILKTFKTNNILKTFKELEGKKKEYQKSKMIEIIKIQEIIREDLIRKNEKANRIRIENKAATDKALIAIAEKVANEKVISNKLVNEKTIENNKTEPNIKLNELFIKQYINPNTIKPLEEYIKTSPPIDPFLKKQFKKRINQISFNENQSRIVINELKTLFNPILLSVLCSTICEQAKHQIANHNESYKLYSLIIYNLLGTNEVFISFLKKRFFLKNYNENIFKGLTFVYFGYLKLINNLKESEDFLEIAIQNENIYSLIVMECFLIVFNNSQINKQYIDKMVNNCKTYVFPKVNIESIKSRLSRLFLLI